MKDFFTRVAERALETAPRVNPQATSRYAPARLPLPAPLLEPPARVVSTPRTSRAQQVKLEPEPAEERIAASIIEPPSKEDDRINAPHQRRKPASSPLIPEPTPRPACELDSRSEFAPEETASASFTVNVSAPDQQTADSHPAPPVSADAPRVERYPDRVEAPEIPDRQDDSPRTVRVASLVEKEITHAAESETQRRSPKSRPPKTVAPVVAELNVIAESDVIAGPHVNAESNSITERRVNVESNSIAEPPFVQQSNSITESDEFSSNSPYEFVAEETASTKVSRPREHQPNTRATVSASLAQPVATTNRRAYERPERREPNIQVKIGRVEVHAPPAPVAPVEAPAPPVPKLSLAEFLRQHNRGRE